VLPAKVLDAFMLLFTKRDERICEAHADVNSTRTRNPYVKRKGCLFFPPSFLRSISQINSPEEADTLIKGSIDSYHRIYMIDLYEDHHVLFIIDTGAKKIYYIDPRLDRRNLDGDIQNYFSATKVSLSLFFGLKEFDLAPYTVELFPSQYYRRNEQNNPTDIEILTILYFL